MINIKEFVRENNKIESILREPTEAELEATAEFLQLEKVDIHNLEWLAAAYQPGVVIRNRVGLDVRVGNYFPPPGGSNVPHRLMVLLNKIHQNEINSYFAHIEYESIHPFTDGNGRTGRTLWLWQMQGLPLAELPFLHAWYYQTLQNRQGYHEDA